MVKKTMIKMQGWTPKLAIGFLVLFFVGSFSLHFMPGYLKSLVIQRIERTTGHTLAIEGPIVWHLGRTISVEFYEGSLHDESTVKAPVLFFKKAVFQNDWFSLVRGRLKLHLAIENPRLHLSSDMFRANNWKNFLQKISAEKLLSSNISLDQIQIHQGEIDWIDAPQQQKIHLSEVDFELSQLKKALDGFYQNMHAQFRWGDQNISKSNAKINIKNEWRFNLSKKQFDLKNIALEAKSIETLPLLLSGELHVKALQPIPAVQGKLQLMNIPLSILFDEKVLLKNDTSSAAHLNAAFKYEHPELDFHSLVLSLPESGTITGTFKSNWPIAPLATADIKGTIEAKNIQLAKFSIAQLQASFEGKNGILEMSPLSAEIAAVQHYGHMTLDWTKPILRLSLQSESYTSDLNPLLKLIHKPEIIQASLKADTQLTAEGTTLNGCLQTIKGSSKLTLSNGQIYGIALLPLLEKAQVAVNGLSHRLLKKHTVNVEALLTAELAEWKAQAAAPKTRLITPFDQLETTLQITGAQLQSDYFSLRHSNYRLNGKGMTDLRLQEAHYEANAFLENQKTPLGIQIKGPLDSLMVHPALGLYAQTVVKQLNRNHPIPLAELPTNTASDINPETQNADLEKLFGTPE